MRKVKTINEMVKITKQQPKYMSYGELQKFYTVSELESVAERAKRWRENNEYQGKNKRSDRR